MMYAIRLQDRAARLYAQAQEARARTDYTLACQLQDRAARMAYRAREAVIDRVGIW